MHSNDRTSRTLVLYCPLKIINCLLLPKNDFFLFIRTCFWPFHKLVLDTHQKLLKTSILMAFYPHFYLEKLIDVCQVQPSPWCMIDQGAMVFSTLLIVSFGPGCNAIFNTGCDKGKWKRQKGLICCNIFKYGITLWKIRFYLFMCLLLHLDYYWF